jgi:ubiquinone/menaquinone biosynthesis C-methylase UbiE
MKLRQQDLAKTIIRNAERRKERLVDHLPTQQAYDRWAAVYDQQDNPLIALEERILPPLVGDVRGSNALDIGCGTGRWTARLVEGGARATGIDFSEEMLGRAHDRLAAIVGDDGFGDDPELSQPSVVTNDLRPRLIEHDLKHPLPFYDSSFDLVLSALVLEHIGSLQMFFREAARVCRPEGRVVVSSLHPAMMLLDSQAEFCDQQSGHDIRTDSYPHQVSDYVMAALRAGLQIEHFSEHEVDEQLQQDSQVAAKFAGWPLLIVMICSPQPIAHAHR